ncbi:MAG: 30S ribosomal protein S8 [Fibrobacterota bacterium]
MAVNDSVADMLTRIRNALMAGHKTVTFPASNLKQEICRILMQEKFIRKFVVLDDGKQGLVKVLLKYKEGESVIKGIERISKPGRRVYAGIKKNPRVLSGLGLAILTTPKGVMTNIESKKQNVGGEVLCYVW